MDPFYDQFVLPAYSTQQQQRKGKRPSTTATAASAGANRLDVDPTITDQLWVDKYEPRNEKDLAIHSRKLKDVNACIQTSAIGTPPGRCNCLVLSGPAGCGKSTTIRTIAKSQRYTVVEWSATSTEQYVFGQEYESGMTKFENFLIRATQLQPLSDPNDSSSAESSNRQRRIILLDDIPDLTSEAVKARFHELIVYHLQNNTQPFLLVIVVSEAWMQTDSTSRWWDANNNETRLTNVRDILPPAFVASPQCTVIEFNPITPKNIEKILSAIQDNEYRRTGHKLSKNRLTHIAELSRGDIRNAINMLQFHCIPTSPSDVVVPAKRRREEDLQEDDTLTQAQHRGAPLDLFHAIGKVLYAKRDLQGRLESPPEQTFDLLPVDSSTFQAFLYANIPKYFDSDDISSCAKALDWISLADSMTSTESWMDSTPSQYQCLLAMRGAMQSRTRPVVTVGRSLTQTKPDFSALSVKRKEPSIGLWNRGLQAKCETEKENPSDWGDDIQNFSDEEFDEIFGDGTDIPRFSDEEFDDLFGDGTDIAELEGW
ncbi:Rad17 cell cycle checkpoint protein-domain-containing protein [Zychaea mexicana]|uniref:Rad17 cell cycle checkpoint protein-domain-containing protein n=1 Tax=Zychaea mexicana TaxID=64656 RepID=UPI0022FF3016|nr:Rad17 cell cycle checkpoint protein-domain-containing protein [Zychaea mexicana]KAI9493629.1 Rad17 cell cycle checkpoint protein-domain-containing protein [Zychaea mexicana]